MASAELWDDIEVPPLPPDDGNGRKRHWTTRDEGEPPARRKTASPADELLTEDSAALEFADMRRGALAFDHDVQGWFAWCGSHWRRETTGLAFEWARTLARDMGGIENGTARRIVGKAAFAAGVERFARSDRAFAVTSDIWDTGAMLLGTPGGTVDLRTGLLRPADPADRITKITAVAPAATGWCPRWLSFLDETMGGDASVIEYLRRFAGYCLTGSTKEHMLFFGYGAGGNGKSVYINVHAGILNDYAVTAPMETFAAAYGDRHPTELAMLRGARLVTATETEEGRAWAESRIKQLTGGDKISAHFMRQDYFTFLPSFKLMIVGK